MVAGVLLYLVQQAEENFSTLGSAERIGFDPLHKGLAVSQ